MAEDRNRDEQVAVRAAVGALIALPVDGDGHAVVHAGGYVDGDLLVAADAALAAAGGAGAVDYLARAAAARARRRRAHDAEGGARLSADGAGAVAVRADLRSSAGGAAGAVAVGAGLDAADAYLLRAAEGGLLKGDAQRGAYALALARGVGVGARPAAAEEGVEYISEVDVDVAEASEPAEAGAPASRPEGRIERGVAELVVFGAVLLVGEDLVGLLYLLEAGLGLLVVGVEVGVILLRGLAERLLYIVLRRVFVDAEDFIVISFTCHSVLPYEWGSLRTNVRRGLAPAIRDSAHLLSSSTTS